MDTKRIKSVNQTSMSSSIHTYVDKLRKLHHDRMREDANAYEKVKSVTVKV